MPKLYDNPQWPEKPLFYASFPSVMMIPAHPKKEAGIFLIPLAPGLNDSDELRNKYFDKIINRLEYLTEQNVKNNIIFRSRLE